MNDETNHELLSAYLDGELSDDERQRVEQLLAESVECRQVYEELRAIRASLSSLPRHKLGEDLGERVLRLAQESKADKQIEAASARREDGKPTAAADSVSAADRASRRWRAIIYPIAAVAAAVAMMLNAEKEKDKKDVHDRQIARAPVGQAPPAEMSAPSDDSVDEASPEVDLHRSLGKFDAAAPHVSDHEDGGSMGGRGPAQKPAPLAEDQKNSPSPALGRAPAVTGIQGGMSAPQAAESNAERGARKAGLAGRPATLVITCKLAPAAVQEKAFEALLVRNHLAARPAAAGVARKPGPAASGPPANAYDSLRQRSERADSSERENIKLDQADKQGEAESRLDKKARAKGPWSKNVVVELDARQLATVLAELRSRPDQFVLVESPGQERDRREPALPAATASPAVPQMRGSLSSKPGANSDTLQSTESRTDNFAADVAGEAEEAAAEDADAFGDGPATAAGSGLARLRVLFRLSEAPAN
ncbi:MAG TPA: zf-HC2 domain-containing protein [Pirellulales bacterium]|jgi:anti-sigma factor RsiW|nr:zf-HC2 domain-containing protein [Pirellulales bacterium]